MATTSYKRGDYDEEVDDPKPARSRRPEPQDEEETTPRRRPQPEPEEEEAIAPRRRPTREPEPEEEERPAPRRRPTREPEPEEEEPAPRRRPSRREEDQDEPPTRALAKRGNTAVDRPRRFHQQMAGEWDSSDATMPYLNIGQKSGNLCDEHRDWIGTFVFDKAVSLGREIRVVFGFMKKRYEETTEYDSPDIPQIWDSKEAADRAGVDYHTIAEMTVWIEVNPKSKTFARNQAMIIDGDYGYIPAKWTVRKTSLRPVTGQIMKDLPRDLNGDITAGLYLITLVKQVKGTNSYYKPQMILEGETSQELRDQIFEASCPVSE